MVMRTIAVLLAALALPLFGLPAAPAKYVTDAAGVLDDARELALNERLAQYDRETTNQLLVYVDRRVPAGTTLEELGAEAIRAWGVGTARKDNGAILFLFVDDRQSRIEVGYGLEGVITDARSKRILVSLRPALRSGDYAGAVEQGVAQIVKTIADPAGSDPAPEPPPRGLIHLDAETAKIVGPALVIGMGVIVGGGGLIFLFILVGGAIRHRRETGRWFPASSGSSSRSGGSSSSSSSFSGGGGSGGGGGASDRW